MSEGAGHIGFHSPPHTPNCLRNAHVGNEGILPLADFVG